MNLVFLDRGQRGGKKLGREIDDGRNSGFEF